VWVHFGEFFDRNIPPARQLFSYREGQMKPASEFFERALGAAGVTAENAVMVGDSYATDLQPAMALGMKTVWVLQRPDREVSSFVRILNGAAAAPSRAAVSIGCVDVELVASLWDELPDRMHRNAASSASTRTDV